MQAINIHRRRFFRHGIHACFSVRHFAASRQIQVVVYVDYWAGDRSADASESHTLFQPWWVRDRDWGRKLLLSLAVLAVELNNRGTSPLNP